MIAYALEIEPFGGEGAVRRRWHIACE